MVVFGWVVVGDGNLFFLFVGFGFLLFVVGFVGEVIWMLVEFYFCFKLVLFIVEMY